MTNNFKKAIILDIETVPQYKTWDLLPQSLKDEWRKKCGNRFEKYDTIEEHYKNNVSFFFPFNKIVCISVIKLNGDKPFSYIGEEKDILQRFSNDITKGGIDWFIGHNIISFDLPIINFRAMVLNIAMPPLIKYFISDNAKQWECPAHDTMKLFKGTSNEVYGLNILCLSLNIPTPKDEISGSDVCKYFYEGKIAEIAKYCEKDVIATKELYLKYTNYINNNVEIK